MTNQTLKTMGYASLTKMIADAMLRNSEHPAMTDMVSGKTLTYGELAAATNGVRAILSDRGIKPGDKVAICGKNCSDWAIAFLGTLTYGAVAVPILNDFNPETIAHLIKHSDAGLVFSDAAWLSQQTDVEVIPFKTLSTVIGNATTGEMQQNLREDHADDLALINYTSGSMGNSKGVMLSYGNLQNNATFAVNNIPYLFPNDGTLCMLPLAHMFGLLVELIFPLLKGCHIHFLGRVPAPAILLKAMAEVKPKLVIAVPLVLEKIIIGRVFPALDKPLMKVLTTIPLANKLIYGKIRKQLVDVFGGNLRQFIVGGAALNKDVEDFLRKIGFPLTIGYGMTECGPLISYAPWDENRPRSCGRIVDGMEIKIEKTEGDAGVIFVRGANVMKGYYKNDDATAEVLSDDGWLNTGDIGRLDDGFLTLLGRAKCMILGPSGQNIYPEEIESKLSALPYVSECLVVKRGNRIVALVYPDYEKAKTDGLDIIALKARMDENLKTLNSSLAKYEQLSEIALRDNEFEKTPKRSIRRYLYT